MQTDTNKQQKRRQTIRRVSIVEPIDKTHKKRASINIKQPVSKGDDSTLVSIFNFFRSIARVLLI